MIRKTNNNDLTILEKIAEEILEPLYGNQDKALSQWLTGEGCKYSFVYISKDQIAGLVVLKADNKKLYLKISTLLVIDDFKGVGIGKKLLTYSGEFAKKNGFSNIIVTVSENKQESIRFFLKNGFNIIDSILGKYKPNTLEFILKKDL